MLSASSGAGSRSPTAGTRPPGISQRPSSGVADEGAGVLGDVGAVLARARHPGAGRGDHRRPQLGQRAGGAGGVQRGQRAHGPGDGDRPRAAQRQRGQPLGEVALGRGAVGAVAAAVDRPHPAVGLADDEERVAADAALAGQRQPRHRRHRQGGVHGVAAVGEHRRAEPADRRGAAGDHAAGGDGRAPAGLLLRRPGAGAGGHQPAAGGFRRRGPPSSTSRSERPTSTWPSSSRTG